MFSRHTHTVEAIDPELWSAIRKENTRQEQHIELIASENYASPAVMRRRRREEDSEREAEHRRMGGALAIGVGFGTQTLLRNFISGIIVLFERKVRVGDIVDVDGVQGIVTAVDVRSTTVRQFDGIETMVPNSLLLENKVTNWTGESPTMRRVVKVGVAYGSPTRQVADILQEAAAEHGALP